MNERIISETKPRGTYSCDWCAKEKPRSHCYMLIKKSTAEIYVFCSKQCIYKWIKEELVIHRTLKQVSKNDVVIWCLQCAKEFRNYSEYVYHKCQTSGEI